MADQLELTPIDDIPIDDIPIGIKSGEPDAPELIRLARSSGRITTYAAKRVGTRTRLLRKLS